MRSPASPARPHALLRVDLAALAGNYSALAALVRPARCAAVVKANAYGLGIARVAERLIARGCDSFFVASLAEAEELRALAPRAQIYSLGGLPEGSVPRFLAAGVRPVLNTVAEIAEWTRAARGKSAALQIDSGMSRAGLDAEAIGELAREHARLEGLKLELVLTHLACADDPRHPHNEAQLARFHALRALLPSAPTSIGNSAGILLGERFRGELARPGIALYGGRPFLAGPNPMREVVSLKGRVLQVTTLAADAAVGYGATHRAQAGARLATVGVGYADGYLRALGNRAFAGVDGTRVPVVGRVSMDLLTLDVSALAPGVPAVGDYVDLMGGGISLEELAALAGTLSYELLARLAPRTAREYVG
jgi:alanine racemase